MKNELLIGTKLYHCAMPKILPYTVYGIETKMFEDISIVYYYVKCEACTDHEKCRVAIKFNDIGVLEYSHMLNNYQGYNSDYDEIDETKPKYHKNEQYHWHCGDYYFSKFDAMEKSCRDSIIKHKESIEKNKKQIAYDENKIAEIESYLSVLKEKRSV